MTGNLKSDGTLAKLTADGHIVLKEAGGALPGGTLEGVGATLDFNGSRLTVSSAAGDWNGLAWTASGGVTASDVRAPALDMGVTLPSAPLTLANGMDAVAALDLRAAGRPASLALSGSAQLLTATVNRSADIESLVSPGGAGLKTPLPPLKLPGPPAWNLNLHVAGVTAVKLANTSGIATPALNITGSIAKPAVSGNIGVKGFTIAQGLDKITIADGTYYLNPASPANPALALHANGIAGGEDFDGYIRGTLTDKHFTWSQGLTKMLAGYADATAAPTLPTPPISPAPSPAKP